MKPDEAADLGGLESPGVPEFLDVSLGRVEVRGGL